MQSVTLVHELRIERETPQRHLELVATIFEWPLLERALGHCVALQEVQVVIDVYASDSGVLAVQETVRGKFSPRFNALVSFTFE